MSNELIENRGVTWSVNKGDTGYSGSLLPGFPIQQDINISVCVSLVVSPSDSKSRSGGLSSVCVRGGTYESPTALCTVQSLTGWGGAGGGLSTQWKEGQERMDPVPTGNGGGGR